MYCPTTGSLVPAPPSCLCRAGSWACNDWAPGCPRDYDAQTPPGRDAVATPDATDAFSVNDASNCPFPNFTIDGSPPDGGSIGDGGLDCSSICPDPGPIEAGPARIVGCAIVPSDAGTALRCEYAHSCI